MGLSGTSSKGVELSLYYLGNAMETAYCWIRTWEPSKGEHKNFSKAGVIPLSHEATLYKCGGTVGYELE